MDARLVGRDPEIMSGALCFTGTRVPVMNLFDYLEGSSSLDDFLEDLGSGAPLASEIIKSADGSIADEVRQLSTDKELKYLLSDQHVARRFENLLDQIEPL
jgi:hypothetical protein